VIRQQNLQRFLIFMASTSPLIVSRKPQARSRITNGSRLVRGVDGRSAAGRRYRDLIENLGADLGGLEKIGEAERVTIHQAATLILRCESLRADLLNGLPVDDEQLTRMANVASRLLTKLGIKRKAQEIARGNRLKAMAEASK
jgi:hypothetical protein